MTDNTLFCRIQSCGAPFRLGEETCHGSEDRIIWKGTTTDEYTTRYSLTTIANSLALNAVMPQIYLIFSYFPNNHLLLNHQYYFLEFKTINLTKNAIWRQFDSKHELALT